MTGALTRRTMLVGLSAALALPWLAACGRSGPGSGGIRITYGRDPSQYADLHLPSGTRRPGTVVVVHGGFWRSGYGSDLGTPLAADLAARGWVAWNIEYRRVGGGGGWPRTLTDVAAAIDKLADVAAGGEHGTIDTAHVAAIGHSAGGHLAAWAASRPALGAGSPSGFTVGTSVAVTGVVSQAGVLDLTTAADDGVGGSAVPDLIGGSPTDVPDRYDVADPTRLLPLGVPVHCVHSRDDGNVPFSQSQAYVAAATAAGDPAVLHEVAGDHFTLIDPTSAAWKTVVGLLPALLA